MLCFSCNDVMKENSQLCAYDVHTMSDTAMYLVLYSIQQSAALALGRLANYSDDLAEAVVQNEILPQLVSVPQDLLLMECCN